MYPGGPAYPVRPKQPMYPGRPAYPDRLGTPRRRVTGHRRRHPPRPQQTEQRHLPAAGRPTGLPPTPARPTGITPFVSSEVEKRQQSGAHPAPPATRPRRLDARAANRHHAARFERSREAPTVERASCAASDPTSPAPDTRAANRHNAVRFERSRETPTVRRVSRAASDPTSPPPHARVTSASTPAARRPMSPAPASGAAPPASLRSDRGRPR